MTIAIVNHKGGTGKTTTTINLGCALAQHKSRVLLIDFDAQGNLSYSLGINEDSPNIADVLLGDVTLNEALVKREKMEVLPGGPNLANIELSIANAEDHYHHLANLLRLVAAYDFILIDCPPSISLLTINALCASDRVIIPMQLDVLALRGLDLIHDTITKINGVLKPELEIEGILPVMVDSRKNLNKEILEFIRAKYSTPVFPHFIRSSVKAAEAPSFGKSVISYAPRSTTAEDYVRFAETIRKKTKRLIHKNLQ